MIKATCKAAVILCFACQAQAVETLTGDELYGTWAMASSSGSAERQILELSPSGGRWVQIKENGESTTYLLTRNDIAVEREFLTIEHMRPAKGFGLKLVLAGWASESSKRIFGTQYLYSDQGDGLSLYNGIPVSFREGKSHLPPQAFWSFFQSDEVQRVDAALIESLAERFSRADGIWTTEDDLYKVFVHRKAGYQFILSKPAHPAYPSALGIRSSARGELETAAKYAGDEQAFRGYYQTFLVELGQQQEQVNQELMELIKQNKKRASDEGE